MDETDFQKALDGDWRSFRDRITECAPDVDRAVRKALNGQAVTAEERGLVEMALHFGCATMWIERMKGSK